MYKKDVKEIILVDRKEENFDKACEYAYSRACNLFGLNEAGIFERVEDAGRNDEIHLEFKGFEHVASRGGHCMIYSFDAWINAYKDEDEDED